jgi:phage terminase Nu1 subunit (DNA packaging protein)
VSHLVTEGALAALFGVDRRTATRWVSAGLPVLRRRGRVVEFDLAAAITWVRGRDKADADARLAAALARSDPDASRARKLALEGDLLQMKKDRESGLTVSAAQAAADLVSVALTVRASLLNVGAIAVQSGVVEPAKEAALDQIIRDALTAMAEREERKEREEKNET